MVDEVVDESQKREVWRRDDFTCRSCGRIVVWDDLRMMRALGPDGSPKEGPDGLVSVCVSCLDENKGALPSENGDRDLLRIKREMEEVSASGDAMVLDRERGSGKRAMEKKVSDLEMENRRLLDELNDKTAMAIAYKKKMDRALKDLENNKRRSENEIALRVRDRTRSLALTIMTALEDLDRAVKDSEKRRSDPKDHEGLVAGLKGIKKALVSQLSGSGIEVMEPLGSPFDPNFQEAIGSVVDKEVPSDTVMMVMSPGCLLDGKVLRPARVMVSSGGPKRVKPGQPAVEAKEGGFETTGEEMECLEEDWGEEENGFVVEDGERPIPVGPTPKPPQEKGMNVTPRTRRCRKRKEQG